MQFITLALYLAACAVCGLIGRQTSFGFFGHFLLAFFITPIGDLVVLLAGRPSRRIRDMINRIPR